MMMTYEEVWKTW